MERPSEYTSEGFSARIHNEKNVTKEEILQSADNVWQVCRERKVDLNEGIYQQNSSEDLNLHITIY